MAKNELTGIERQLVLDYLQNNAVPLTLSLENSAQKEAQSAQSISFPQVLRAEQVHVLEKGIILLKNPSEPISSFEGESVKVQFYYNKLALYFVTKMQRSSAGLVLVIPSVINKIEEKQERAQSGFSVIVYYEIASAQQKVQKTEIICDFDERFPLFVAADYQKRIERYLSEPIPLQNEAIEGRTHAPKVIYIDAKRIVFAAKKSDFPFLPSAEYALLLKFPIAGPIKERKVFVSCIIEQMFENYDCDRLCACAVFSSVREEDERFLGDKMPAANE